MKVDAFDFILPPEQIASHPLTPRENANLLHVQGDNLTDRHIYDLPSLLNAGDILVCNDTKVIPARLFGKRDEIAVELLLHKQEGKGIWCTFARPGKRLKVGQTITIAEDFHAEVLEKRDTGEVVCRFDAEDAALFEKLEAHGSMPLPPYIQRKAEILDKTDYQTVYARHKGAVAAPTAGLHITPELLQTLDQKGVHVAYITLHVGAGTFQPVKVDDTEEHVMHSEYGEISAETAAAINKARQNGGRIIAVGTTSLRLLESAADNEGNLHPFCAETDIFITPGYRFKAVDCLMTNFHLPRSTLFMLVSAFSGLDTMQNAYRHAIANQYRFYSYGDACFLERTTD